MVNQAPKSLPSLLTDSTVIDKGNHQSSNDLKREISKLRRQIDGSASAFSKYEPTLIRDCPNDAHVFLHPDEDRDYTDEELENVSKRPFTARLHMTATNINGEAVWLRNRHTDNVQKESYLRFVRNIIKATIATQNYTSAKTCLAELLTMYFDMRDDQYFTAACTLASALSNKGKNTTFEITEEMVKSTDDIELVRMKYLLLMEIVFSKFAVNRFLVDESRANIYRLAHCMTKGRNVKWPLGYAFFSFTLQICLVSYIVLEIYEESYKKSVVELNHGLYPLSFFTLIFSTMVAFPEVRSSWKISRFYGHFFGWLYLSDFFSNVIIPILLIFVGCWVIIIADSFIDAVLNTTALLFIPEVDDILPKLLELDIKETVQNYLIDTAMVEYDETIKLTDQEVRERFDTASKHPADIDFHDIYVTNTAERGSSPSDGIHLGPYEIKKGVTGCGDRVVVSKFVNDNCLLSKIEWRYTTGFKNTTDPRVGYLKLWKLDGSSPVVIEERGFRHIDIEEQGALPTFSVEGVFIITFFQMSNSVLKLRICGSKTKEDFMKAFKYYSLWDLDTSAKRLLQRHKNPPSSSPNVPPPSTKKESENNTVRFSLRPYPRRLMNTIIARSTTTSSSLSSSSKQVIMNMNNDDGRNLSLGNGSYDVVRVEEPMKYSATSPTTTGVSTPAGGRESFEAEFGKA